MLYAGKYDERPLQARPDSLPRKASCHCLVDGLHRSPDPYPGHISVRTAIPGSLVRRFVRSGCLFMVLHAYRNPKRDHLADWQGKAWHRDLSPSNTCSCLQADLLIIGTCNADTATSCPDQQQQNLSIEIQYTPVFIRISVRLENNQLKLEFLKMISEFPEHRYSQSDFPVFRPEP